MSFFPWNKANKKNKEKNKEKSGDVGKLYHLTDHYNFTYKYYDVVINLTECLVVKI